jgi:hypothetical protein
MVEHSVEVIEWLSLIEHCWKKLKELIYLNHPELLTLSKNFESIKDLMFEAIKEA